jgi:hypothetical protein
MASPNNSATERTNIFSEDFAFSFKGIVLVTIIRSSLEFSILSIASPDKTGWVQAA